MTQSNTEANASLLDCYSANGAEWNGAERKALQMICEAMTGEERTINSNTEAIASLLLLWQLMAADRSG